MEKRSRRLAFLSLVIMCLAMMCLAGVSLAAVKVPKYHYVELPTRGADWHWTTSTINSLSWSLGLMNKNGQVAGTAWDAAAPGGKAQAVVWDQTGQMTPLGTLGGSESWAYVINDKGQAVGESYLAGDTEKRAFIFQMPNGPMKSLAGDLGDSSAAYTINNKGQVAGEYYLAGDSHPFLWTAKGGMQGLGSLPYVSQRCYAIKVNSKGQVAGQLSPADRGFFWTAKGGIQDLTNLGGGNCYVNDLNDKGQVVGGSYTGSEYRPFVWTAKGGIQGVINTLGGDQAWILRINKKGQAIGWARETTGNYYGFFWTAQDGMQKLDSFGGAGSNVTAINKKGQVVGRVYDPVDHPYLWSANMGMQDLNDLVVDLPPGVSIWQPYALNDKGVIFGQTTDGKPCILIPTK
jgi:uncharacterized membrane protein